MHFSLLIIPYTLPLSFEPCSVNRLRELRVAQQFVAPCSVIHTLQLADFASSESLPLHPNNSEIASRDHNDNYHLAVFNKNHSYLKDNHQTSTVPLQNNRALASSATLALHLIELATDQPAIAIAVAALYTSHLVTLTPGCYLLRSLEFAI